MLQRAAGEKTPLVTNEGLTETGINDDPKKLRARAIAVGVGVFTPKEYLDAEGHEVLDLLVPLYRHILLGEVDSKYEHLIREQG